MSDTSRNGGPAFPIGFYDPRSADTFCNSGMSLRDWFAGQALSSAGAHMLDEVAKDMHLPDNVVEYVTRQAYVIADAMLAARDSKPQ